jgi:RNA polymerase sigma-70 factor, ECF subfamily
MKRSEVEVKTDAELVQLSLIDQDYFLYLIQRYEEKLLRYILRISNASQEDAEDILQEVFIKVYRNLNAFDQTLKFSSWIYRITYNETISHFRRIKNKPIVLNTEDSLSFFDSIASDVNIETEFEVNEKKRLIMKILERLDDKYKEVLILKFLEEKDYEEISDILKKPTGTIGTLINRGKKKFKEECLQQGINFN